MSAESFSRYGSVDLSKQAQDARVKELELPQGDVPVITGYSALTGLGDAFQTYNRMLNGESAVRLINTTVGGKIVERVAAPIDFDPKLYFDRKALRGIPNATALAMFLAKEAAKMADILGGNGKLKSDFDGDRAATTVATSMERVPDVIDKSDTLRSGNRIHPLDGLSIFLGQQAGHISEYIGLRGWGNSSTEACASGLSSIADAAELIRTGRNDIVLAGGLDDILNNHPELGPEIFGSMGAYSDRVDDPKGASRPFDKGRDGIVIGSGGAVLVVEGMRHAIARGATIHAVILGAEKGMDGFDPVLADSDRIARLILKTLKRRGEEGFYSTGAIFAHATSTPKGDSVEIDALRKVFGESLNQIPITAPKSAFGHLLGGAGAVNALLAINSLQTGIIPPTLNLENSDFPELNIVTSAAKLNPQTALATAYGMGGLNATVLFGKY
jgi:3-oxoacyl-[acyl-carrier-protein] synthase II